MHFLRNLFLCLAIGLGLLTIIATGSSTPSSPPDCVDADGDGYISNSSSCTNPGIDCNDNDIEINPGAKEQPYNGIDEDCNPATKDDDLDGDSYPIATDCDDTEILINPGVIDICGVNADYNCDGTIDGVDCGDRFTDMNDGTVRDNKTGLIWLKNANAFGLKKVISSGWNDDAWWDEAMALAETLDETDFEWLTDGSSQGDWRLPTINELEALVDTAYNEPALSNAAGDGQWTEGDVFTGVQSHWYCSSDSDEIYTDPEYAPDYGWPSIIIIKVFMYMSTGEVPILFFQDYDDFYIWPVRSGPDDFDGERKIERKVGSDQTNML